MREKIQLLNLLELFNNTTINIIFSFQNADLLPFERHYPMHQHDRIAFAKVLEEKLADESSAGSPFHQSVNGCIDRLETLSPLSPFDEDTHRVYTGILCTRTVNMLGMRQAIQRLSPQDRTAVEGPLRGALVLAAATGDVAAIAALLSRGMLVDDESNFFGSALCSAAAYGHMNVLEILLSTNILLLYDALIGAIRGGNKVIVGELLNKFNAVTHDTELEEHDLKGLLVDAAAEDHTEILDMLMEHIPECHEVQSLKPALYHAVLFSAKSTTRRLIALGVDISDYEESLGNGLYVASKRGDLETVQLLVEHGFKNGNGPNSYDTCMHVAAAKGYITVVEYFLHLGVDVNCRFPCTTAPTGMDEEFWDMIDGDDPATTNAARNGDFRMFCFLVQRGCRVDHDNEFASLQKQWLERLRAWEDSRLIDQ